MKVNVENVDGIITNTSESDSEDDICLSKLKSLTKSKALSSRKSGETEITPIRQGSGKRPAQRCFKLQPKSLNMVRNIITVLCLSNEYYRIEY